MAWSAVTLELGLLALALFVLAYDLAVGHRSAAARRGNFVIAATGLALLLVVSFALPPAERSPTRSCRTRSRCSSSRCC